MNPYPGLRPFRADEAGLFTGRELAADLIATRLRVAPLTLLFARSGVGKSSFLTCRLIPLLTEASNVAYLNEWGSERPAVAVDRQVQSLLAADRKSTERPVLILDQFEDIFKLPDPRDDLWDLLAGLVNVHDAPVRVLISMREEWLGSWIETADYLPDALGSLVRLPPLSDGELTQAIRRPVELEREPEWPPGPKRGAMTKLLRRATFPVELVCTNRVRRHPPSAPRAATSRTDPSGYDRLAGRVGCTSPSVAPPVGRVWP